MGEMSVRRTKSANDEANTESVFESKNSRSEKKFGLPKWLVAVLVILAALLLYWYKTNTWPIVAMVGYKPITRYEIEKGLFAKSGESEIENRVTEIQVETELAKMGIKTADADVDSKINEIKASLGEGSDIEAILSSRGLSLQDYRRQLKLLLGAEKAVAGNVTVNDEEVAKYLEMSGASATDSAAVDNARESVRLSKVDQEISKWVLSLADKYKVWKMPAFK
jgi:foldase protein PrsA